MIWYDRILSYHIVCYRCYRMLSYAIVCYRMLPYVSYVSYRVSYRILCVLSCVLSYLMCLILCVLSYVSYRVSYLISGGRRTRLAVRVPWDKPRQWPSCRAHHGCVAYSKHTADTRDMESRSSRFASRYCASLNTRRHSRCMSLQPRDAGWPSIISRRAMSMARFTLTEPAASRRPRIERHSPVTQAPTDRHRA